MKPQQKGPQPLYTTPKRLFLDLLYISTGCILCAIAINGILIPHQYVTGGITGLAMLIHKFIPSVNAGWIYFFINVPLFILAWMTVGRRFFFYSIIGAVSLTLSMAYIHFPIVLEDKILDALLAGLLVGAGAGITLKSSGSQGGVDILSVLLLKRFSISIGNTVLCVNVILLLMVAFLYSLESLLYTLIVLFVSSKIVSLVVTGLSQRKAVFIISPHWEQIAKEILKDIRRGVTILEGEGGYTRCQEHILYTVVNLRDIGQLKRVIQQIDENAFVVISDTLEVVNYRIGNQPHW